jgi:Fe-S-cluster containining protein
MNVQKTTAAEFSSCTCSACVRNCERNPGWMSLEEAEKAIGAGMATRLMRDWLEADGELGNKARIYVLSAASIGHEGTDAPEIDFADALMMLMGTEWTKGRCTFLKNNLCQIHDSGFKPQQCRESMGCKEEPGPDNFAMARQWNTEEGRALVARWEKAVSG